MRPAYARRSGRGFAASCLRGLVVAALAVSCATDGAREEEPPEGPLPPKPSASITTSLPGAVPERVILISVAGLQPEHYGGGGPGIVRTAGVAMPNLATLAAHGAYANAMIPVLPAALYPAHATLATGLLPIHHQVLGDELIGPQGIHVRGISRESRIHGVPLWRAAEAEGRTSVALNWPLTRGAEMALLLPDMGVPELEPEGTWYEQLQGEASPWILDRLKLIDAALPSLPWPSPALRDELVENLACQIARQPVTPDLWLLAFEQTGTAMARDGPVSDGASLALQRVDAAIGRIVDCLAEAGIAESTAILVVGDRALQPIQSIVYPNVALERVGLITQAPMLLGAGITSWRAFARSYGGAAVVYAEDEDAALLAREALREESERTRAFRIVSATVLSRMDADPQAWFGLEAVPGYGLGKSARGQAVEPTERRGLGGYLPSSPNNEVGFVAWGAGVRPGVRVARMQQVDVAPTVAALLGMALTRPDGAPAPGVLGAAGAAR